IFERIFTREAYGPAKEAMTAKLSDFSYSIVESRVDGRSATVSVAFQYYDLADAMNRIPETYWKENYGSYVTQQATSEQLEQAMIALIERELAALQNKNSATVAIHLDRNGRDWRISDLGTWNEPLLCVLTGEVFGPVESVVPETPAEGETTPEAVPGESTSAH
ncbi:MAG: hypothetical protein LBQ16_06050, partial [Gracilibacteraceae bacterium]|nr:hypothetical protein [Gracilibacteraceae bacterium]